MKRKLHLPIPLFRSVCAAACLLFFCISGIHAQTTISTTGSFTNDTTVNTVTFNFQNTNAYPVVIKSIDGILSDYGQMNVAFWYKTSAINGNPGTIATTNAWTMLNTATVSGISNLTDNVTQPFFTGLNLVIPANTTYGIAITASASGVAKLRAGHGLPAFTIGAGGCNVISGTNSGYAGMSAPPAAPTFSPVAWLGKITFAQYLPCTGTPSAAIISGPTNVCAGALFTLTSIPYPAGTAVNYQWQKYNTTTLTWQDSAFQTQNIFNCAGISTSSQFRLRTSCPSSGVPVYSNVLTVNIGSGLPGGVYTINNNAQSTATNFVSFSAAAAAMKCGITGPVTINVDPASGPYTEQVFFNNIPGTSVVNKIRINGNGRILQYNNSNSSFPAIFNMKGVRYMSLDSLTIRSLGRSVGIGISITDTARRDSVSHCFIDIRSLNVISNLNNAGIILSDYQSPGSYSNIGYSDAKSCYIGYNYILGTNGTGGPYYGILNDPINSHKITPTDSGNVMVYNVIENFVNCGIYSNRDNGTLIAYNDIHCTNKAPSSNQFLGIVCWGRFNHVGSSVLGSNLVTVVGNRIHNPSNTLGYDVNNQIFFGIELMPTQLEYITTSVYTGCKIIISNNLIYNVNSSLSNYVHGIYLVSQNNFHDDIEDFDTVMIYHNTIDISHSTNVNHEITGIWYEHGFSSIPANNRFTIFIKNNLVTMGGSPVVDLLYGFHYANNYGFNENLYAQRNNFYINNPAPNRFYGSYHNVDYTTLNNFQTAYPSMEVGSLSVNPQYYSPSTGDFTPLNFTLSGNGQNLLADVPTDILGRPRSSAPTPGAFEIVTDAGVTALLSPSGAYCSSSKMVQVNVHNYGVLNISNVQLNWRLNGVLQTPITYIGTIAPNGNAAVSLSNVFFPFNTPVTIKAWTSNPNGQEDGFHINDTLTITTQSSTSISVNIGSDDTICTGDVLALDAGNPGAAYMWDNFSTAQTRTVQNAGTYYVKVITTDGCIGFDTMHLSLRPLPVVDLGPDVEICEGTAMTFDAGNPGAAYMWNDGSTAQTRTVDTAGDYEVQVTDIHGCIGADTVTVTMKNMPMLDAINATHADSGLYTFYPLNPQYATDYIWNFGDSSPEVSGFMVQHQYQHNGIYTVMLKLEGECPGIIVSQARTVEVFNARGAGTGIGNMLIKDNIFLYPNPAKDMVRIENKSDAGMIRVAVYNALGQIIINQKTDHTQHHQLNTAALASGLYSIRIETDKGMFIQKFEVMK